jgi:ATP-dependent Clp protease ATP-binding subunit ClpB
LNWSLADNELSIQLRSEVLDHTSFIGYDPVYGARPLKRAIENLIENPLAEEVLRGSYVAGDTITVELHSTNGLVFGKLMTDLDQAVV